MIFNKYTLPIDDIHDIIIMDRPKYRIASLLTKTPLTIKNILIVGAGGIGC